MSAFEVLSLSPHWSRDATPSGYGREYPVSFTLAIGQRLAIVGDNGIGKTTLLHAMAGTVPYVSGYVRIGPTTLPPRDVHARYAAGIMHVPQNPFFRSELSWHEAVGLARLRRPGVFNED